MPYFCPVFLAFLNIVPLCPTFFEKKVALIQLMAVLCLGKFLFWPFLGQKYIACGDIIWFWAVFGHFLSNLWWFFVNFLLFKLSLLFKNGKWKFLFWLKNRGHFWTIFWFKIWPFSLKNKVFEHFLRNRSTDLSKTWSETGDNYFESLNDNVMSGKILVLAVFGHFLVKNTLHVVTLYGFGLFLAIFFQTVDDFLLIFAI